MAISDRVKLMRMDEDILNLEYLYTRELMREQELNKKNLLMSRGFKYRLDNLKRARNKLKQAISHAPTKRMNYAATLAEKVVMSAVGQEEFNTRSPQNPFDTEGEIISIDANPLDWGIHVRWSNGRWNCYRPDHLDSEHSEAALTIVKEEVNAQIYRICCGHLQEAPEILGVLVKMGIFSESGAVLDRAGWDYLRFKKRGMSVHVIESQDQDWG